MKRPVTCDVSVGLLGWLPGEREGCGVLLRGGGGEVPGGGGGSRFLGAVHHTHAPRRLATALHHLHAELVLSVGPGRGTSLLSDKVFYYILLNVIYLLKADGDMPINYEVYYEK